MDEGELVPDDVVIGVIEECLAPGSPLSGGFVLDGFPRTIPQANELDRLLDGWPIDVAVNLEVPTEIVLDRIAGRRTCVVCQRVYHVNMPPESGDWTCDDDGGNVVQREDDTEEAVLRRLELYETETAPIVDHFRRQAKLAVVDGVGEGDEVFDRLVQVIEARLSGTPEA
jgi:adenylate kinase